MQSVCRCSYIDVNYHVKLVKFCWINKTLIPSVLTCTNSTISHNVYICCIAEPNVCLGPGRAHGGHCQRSLSCGWSQAAVFSMKNASAFSLSTFCLSEAHLTWHLKTL